MMRKVRVAFFADCLIKDYDGAIRTMYQIIERIPRSEFEFLFVTGDPPQHAFDHEVVVVPSVVLPINHNYKMSLGFLQGTRIKEKLDAFAPDVIHIATPSPTGHMALQYGVRRGLPIVSIYHTHFLSYVDTYLKKAKGLIPPVQRYLISVMQKFYNQCDVVYVPTPQMIKELRHIGVFSTQMSLWQRGIDTEMFHPSKRDTNHIQNITQNKQKNVLFCSRLVMEKNLETLVDIYQQSIAKELPLNFIIAGDGYARDSLMKQMPQAHFLRHLNHENLSVLYASADVFLFPSISETYGNVIIEAQASGLPCVIGDGGGTKDLVTHMYNGLVCAPHDAGQYIEAIQLIIDDEVLLCKQITQNALSGIKGLSWDTLCDRYFEDLLSLSGHRIKKIA